jgi:hypothetical protein
LPAAKQGLNLEQKAEKALIWTSPMSECHWSWCSIYFTEKWRAEPLQPGLEFDNVKLLVEGSIFNASSGQTVSSLGGNDRGFLKDGVKNYPTAPMPLLNSPTLFPSSHL